MKINILTIAAVILLATACDKKVQDKTAQAGELSAEKASQSQQSLLLSDCDCCPPGSNSLYFDANLSDANSGRYDLWTPQKDTLCEDGLILTFEGQFGSFIRVDGTWAMATIPQATGDNWCNNILPALSLRCGNTTTSPYSNAPTSYGPPTGTISSVIGINGALNLGMVTYGYGLGYYDYAFPGATPSIHSDIVIWKNCGGTTGPCITPAAGYKAYRIHVSDIDPQKINGVWDSEISYSWECITIPTCL
ncbi:MAG: hypothetical protein P0Y53_17815 [Candidatus Pseudobacter hemicellulosilyticus]|uniref:Uncharacterized protein n=1 Tax=Candidatus Pseudobacter hemicellulosilyticus TaxID=3121375 RepID=A0AAJ5WLX2_9BACT|nr:MAG: hypothetical protein P0Y53_17815 [Pseudobacter sp.]